MFTSLENVETVVGMIPPAIGYILVFTSVGTIAGLWEFYEFVYDWLFGTHTQLSITDTMSDMFFGMLGSLVFLVARKMLARKPL
ncbi:MAG TPA: hypothetical protein VET48_03375 [Steroidobacteraceae bacterium]|nr:hypothetical protein [Steroidobacteraceae bacterium]